MSKVQRKQNIKPPMLVMTVLNHAMKNYLLTVVLVLATLASAFGLIVLSHKQRNLYAELEQLHTERNQLDVEWRELSLEQRHLGEHARLEQVATKQLGMKNLDVKSERIIRKINEAED